MKSCQSQNARGSRCRSHAVAGSEYCFFHDPQAKEQRTEAQRKGGRGLKPALEIVPDPPPHDFDLSDPAQISEFLSYAANGVVHRRLDPKEAHAIAHLGECALRAYDAVTLTARLEKMERLQAIDKSSAIFEVAPPAWEFTGYPTPKDDNDKTFKRIEIEFVKPEPREGHR